MIDEDIEIHLRDIVSEAFPNVEESQVLVLFPTVEMSFNINDLKRCDQGIPISYERINCRLVIDHELKLEREEILRRLPRKHIKLGDRDVFQEVRQVVHTNNVEVINFKGIMFEIIFGNKIFKL